MKDAIHEIYKHRLSKNGMKQGFPERQQELGNTLQNEKQLEVAAMEHAEEQRRLLREQIGSCGHCYGAGRPGECCNTCQDVKDAYTRVGWHFKAQGVLQCQSEAVVENVIDQNAIDGGCQVHPHTHTHSHPLSIHSHSFSDSQPLSPSIYPSLTHCPSFSNSHALHLTPSLPRTHTLSSHTLSLTRICHSTIPV